MAYLIGIGLLAALPVLALLAVMAGPVIVIVLCALGFGLIANLLGQVLIRAGVVARSAERGAVRRIRG